MEIIIAIITTTIGAAAAVGGALTKHYYNKRNTKKKLFKENIKKFTELHHKIIDIINNIHFSDTINTAFYLSNFIYLINQEIQEKYDLYDFLTVYQKDNLFPVFKQAENLICHSDYLGFNKTAIKDTSLNNYIEFTKEFDNIKNITFSKLEKSNDSFILSTFDAISELFKDIKKELHKQKINSIKVKELDNHKNELRKAVLVIEKSFIRYKQKQLKE
jgi:uncharacterized membrane protein YkoI